MHIEAHVSADVMDLKAVNTHTVSGRDASDPLNQTLIISYYRLDVHHYIRTR